MECTRCKAECETQRLAFTKPMVRGLAEDVGGEFCDKCLRLLNEHYKIIYRPDKITRAEARED